MPCRSFIARKNNVYLQSFKGQADSRWLGTNTVDDLQLRPMLIYHSENPTALKNHAKLTCPVVYKWNNKACMTAYLFMTWLIECSKPIVEKCCSGKKKVSLKNNTALGHPVHLVTQALGWSCTTRLVCSFFFFFPYLLTQHPFCSPWPWFTNLILHETFCRAIATIDSVSSDGFGKSPLKTFKKWFTILDAR